MSSFGSRTFADGSVSTYFTLANEEYIRYFSWLNGWNSIRIGISCAIQGSSGFTLTDSGLGICAGATPVDNTQGAKSGSTTHWVGGFHAGHGYGTTTVTYTSTPPAYFTIPNIYVGAKGQTGDTGSGGVSSTIWNAAGNGYRGWWFVDICKDGRVRHFGPSSTAQAQINFGMIDLLTSVDLIRMGTLNIQGTTISQKTGSGAIFTVEPQPLNCISIYWPMASNPLEVYGISVYGSWQNENN